MIPDNFSGIDHHSSSEAQNPSSAEIARADWQPGCGRVECWDASMCRGPEPVKQLAVCASVTILVTTWCSGVALADQLVDAKLTAFCKAYLDDLFRQRPSVATRLGDHRVGSHLTVLGPDDRRG